MWVATFFVGNLLLGLLIQGAILGLTRKLERREPPLGSPAKLNSRRPSDDLPFAPAQSLEKMSLLDDVSSPC